MQTANEQKIVRPAEWRKTVKIEMKITHCGIGSISIFSCHFARARRRLPSDPTYLRPIIPSNALWLVEFSPLYPPTISQP